MAGVQRTGAEICRTFSNMRKKPLENPKVNFGTDRQEMGVDMPDQSKAVKIRWKEVFFVTLLSFLLAAAQFRLILLVMGTQYNSLVDAALGVIQGHPHWVLYQSRVLGPYSVEFISLFVGDFLSSHSMFIILMTATSGILIFLLVHREYGRDTAWAAFFLLNLLFAVCNNKHWLYTWDYWDIVIFLTFTYFVLSGKNWVWFLTLFSIAVFNRESALFIAFWMILDPIMKYYFRKEPSQFNWKMFISGVGAGAVGFVIILNLRYLLLVEETMLKFSDLTPKSQFHFQLWHNLAYVRNLIVAPCSLNETMHWLASGTCAPEPDLVVLAFLLAVLILALVLALRDPRCFAGLGLTYVALTAAIFLFGTLAETRELLEFVPFLALGSSARKGTAGALKSSERGNKATADSRDRAREQP
jgi:hypothetical protein